MSSLQTQNKVVIPYDPSSPVRGELVTINDQVYQIVDKGVATNQQINGQWSTMLRWGAIGLACLVGIKLVSTVLAPPAPSTTVVYPPSQPSKTCVFSLGC